MRRVLAQLAIVYVPALIAIGLGGHYRQAIGHAYIDPLLSFVGHNIVAAMFLLLVLPFALFMGLCMFIQQRFLPTLPNDENSN